MREYDVGIGPAHGVQHLRARLVRVEKALVVVPEKTHLCPVNFGRLQHFSFTRLAYELRVRHHVRPGVAARRQRDEYLVTLLLVLEKRATYVVFNVVGMRPDRKNVHLFSSFLFCLCD